MINVIFEESTYLSANGKTRVHAYTWRPDGVAPRGIIQLAHGMCEYVQRYDAWARRFCAAGYVFCGNDHLGHGRTAPDEEELGFTDAQNGAEYLVEDLHTQTARIRAEYPDVPVILYGHSMGSFVARLYLSRYGKELAAAVISGTAGPEQPAALARRLTRVIAAAKGAHHRSRFLTSVAFGSYNKRFSKEQDIYSWITRDKTTRASYATDPLCSFVFTAAGYDTLFALLAGVSDKKWPQTVPKTLPILLLSGDMDPVGAYGKGVRTVYKRLCAAGCTRVTLRLYEQGRHEMHNELNRDAVFADILTFLEEALQ